jgi:hypothetical protein
MAETTEKGWCIVEVLGHRKLAGYVSDDGGLVRIDVYLDDPASRGPSEQQASPIATQWYGPAAIYCITATTVQLAVKVAKGNQPRPVGHWELPDEKVLPLAVDDDPDLGAEPDDDADDDAEALDY